MTQPCRVLFVCTGNVCRSPIAERLALSWLRSRLGEDAAAFDVSSAGTRGLSGEPMHPLSAGALTELGGDSSPHRARVLEPGHVRASDLVLGLERRHRAAAVALEPRAVRRTFSLRELARLAAAVDPSTASGGADLAARARAAVAEASAVRGMVPPPRPGEDDIEDPIGASTEVHARVAREIADALDPVLALLIGSPARRVAGPQ